jgi:hypothetical protein
MSTLKVSAINNAAASSGGLSIDSSGVVSGGLPSPNRNLLYNGAMQVAQRGTSTASITTTGYYTADRWAVTPTAMGTWTNSVEEDAPSGSGISKSFKLLCTTADATPSADDYIFVTQMLEGFDVQRIAKGTASAQQLTLSFWVKSNVTGTYNVNIRDAANSRVVGAQYSISSSSTWEKKTITFPADTTGAFANDNSAQLQVRWWLGSGTNRTSGSVATVWESQVLANFAPGQTNLASATNNYWQITGVQLEVGPTATPFEFKSYGTELAECQRYYEKSYNQATAPGAAATIGAFKTIAPTTTGIFSVDFKVSKRAAPTVTTYSTSDGASGKYRDGTSGANFDLTVSNESESGYWATLANHGAADEEVQWQWQAAAEL